MATLASPSVAASSHSSLSMLPPSTLALAQQQAAYNSLFSLGTSSASSLASQPHLQPRNTSPPVPVSAYANLPSSSLLATSLYPLLTLGIAGGAVSGELGTAAWNAFQQSQIAQAQAGSSQMHEPPGVHNHPHASYLSHSQPMSTLSSERIDSPASLQTPLDSIRTSSPRYSASSSPASFSAARPSASSPRFDTAPFDRYEPGTRPSVPQYDAQFDSQSYQFGPAHTAPGPRSGSGSGSGSPHNFATPAPVPARTTPPGYGSSSSSTPPGSALAQGGRRGSGSSGGDGQ